MRSRALLITAVLTAALLVGLAAVALASRPREPVSSPDASGALNLPACLPADRRTLTSARAGANTQLVPGGSHEVLICRYYGLNEPGVYGEPSMGLSAQAVVTDPTTVAALAVEMNALPPVKPGPVACPADLGAAIVVDFRYATGPDNPVTVSLTGCQGVANGHTGRQTTAAFLARLMGFVPVPTDAVIRGQAERCGGPAPGGCVVGTITVCGPPTGCITDDRVAILTASGRRVALIKLRHARFRAELPPGRYTVKLLGDGPHVHRRVIQKLRVVAKPGRTATVVLMFAVP